MDTAYTIAGTNDDHLHDQSNGFLGSCTKPQKLIIDTDPGIDSLMASDSAKVFLPLVCTILILLPYGEGRTPVSVTHLNGDKHVAYTTKSFFVFGDSYVDTGNLGKSVSFSWKEPYGITFPGKPAGRFSDGRVLTDYIAQYLGMRSPVPYRLRKYFPVQRVNEGINFAHGGSGVFNTLFPVPNMTVQIDFLEKMIKDSVYTSTDLNFSYALVSLAGNDYSAYLVRNGSLEGLTSFIETVVKQLSLNIRRIQALGVRKIAVTGLQPVGCLPSFTALNDFKACVDTLNAFVSYHNKLLSNNIRKYNDNREHHPNFVLLDLYHAFRQILETKHSYKPCCTGVSSGDSCGDIDTNGTKRYKVCDDPNGALFWDTVHPTQAGWRAVYSLLRSTLKKFPLS